VDLGGGHVIVADQFVFVINGDVVFVTVVLLAILPGPAGITVFLAIDVRVFLEAFGDLPRLDLVVLFATVALDRGADKARINNLTFLGFEAFVFQLQVEIVEQCFNEALLGQLFPEQPDCFGIRDPVFRTEPQETTEAVAVSYLKLQLIIRDVVKRLQDQGLNIRTTSKGSLPALLLRGLSRLLLSVSLNASQSMT